MSNLESLKKLVSKNIEAGGFMNQIRAQLKVEVFKIIENQDSKTKDQAGFQWEHPQLKKIKETSEGMKCLELILDFLECFKFDYTLQVLRKEANIPDSIQRENLASKVGLDVSRDFSRPLLMVMASQFGKPVISENTQKHNQKQQQEKREDQKREEQLREEKRREEQRREEQRKEEEKKKKQEEELKKKKELEEEKKNKQQQNRPQTAPIPKPEAPTINKIRGAPMKNLTSMFGINIGGAAPIDETEEDIFKPDPIFGKQKKNDPYAFDLDEQNIQKKDKNYKQKKEKEKEKEKQYDYDLNKTIGKKFNNPLQMQAKSSNRHEEIEEDIDFQESRDDRAKQSNQLFTSDEDFKKASQSLGVDESVDSLALEEYDYYEDVHLKR